MPIDTSMYANIQPVQPPNILGNAEVAMKLSQLGMQNAAMQRQFQTQAVVKQAYLDNTDSSGNLDRQGLLSQIGQFNPQVAQDQANALYQGDKTKAEAQTAQAATESAQVDAQNKLDDYMFPKLQLLASTPTDQQPALYNAIKQQFASSGIHSQLASGGMQAPQLPDDFDPTWLKNTVDTMQGRTSNINNEKAIAETNKANSEAGNVQTNLLTGAQKTLLTDPDYKDATKTLAQSNNARAAVTDALVNPQSKASLGLLLARLTPDGTRLPADQIQKMALAGNFGDKIKQMVSDTTTGTLNQNEADYANQFINTQAASAAQNKLDTENDHAAKYAVATGLPKDMAYSRLTGQAPGTLAQVPSPADQFSSGQSGKSSGPDYAGAANWLKTADQSSPKAFQIRAALKAKGLIQ